MERSDVIILGGGLVGLTLALALDRHGLSAAIVDPADPATTTAPAYDGRATAIASASWRMFETLGIAERLEGEGCAIRTIRVSEGLSPGGIVFDAPEEDDPLGIMVENRRLRQVLREAAGEAGRGRVLMAARGPRKLRGGARGGGARRDGRGPGAPLLG